MKALALALALIHIPLPFQDDDRSLTKGPLGNDPVAVSLPASSAVQVVDRGARGTAIVRRGASASVTLARVTDARRGNTMHASRVAVSGTTWIAAVTGGRSDGNMGEGGADFVPRSEIVITGSLGGGPVRRLTSCKSSRGELSIAVSGADVAYSGGRCSRGVWLIAGGARVQLAAHGDVRALSPATALVSDQLLGRNGGAVRLPRFRAAAFDDDGTLLALDGERLSRVGIDGTVSPLGEFHLATGDLAVGAGRALVGTHDGVVVVNTATGLSSVVARGPLYPLAVDGTRAAWLGEFAPGRPVVFVDAGAG